MNKWWKSVRLWALMLLEIGLLLTVLGIHLLVEAGSPLAVGVLVLGAVGSILGAVWIVFGAPAVRASRRRAVGVFFASLAFALVAVFTGIFTGWDMLASVGSAGRRAPAWLLIVLSLTLALPGGIAAVRTFAEPKPRVWRVRPLFDEQGTRIHYDED